MRVADQYRFRVQAFALSGSPADLSLQCGRCGRWTVHIAEPITLADLIDRADEHAEVCR